MAFTELEKKRVENAVARYIEKNRPPAEIRHKVDLSYRIDGQSVVLFEIRPMWNDPSEQTEEPVAKCTYVRRQQVWKVYWQRADLKWHSYQPDPEAATIDEFLEIVERDECACFYG